MIDRKEKVVLGGIPQKIHILGSDPSNPVLLFLHGGPGVCNRHSVVTSHADLTDSFTIVAWDQRGSGGSYPGGARHTLTVDQLVQDAHELVCWLCDTFSKDKVFIIGGSWGSQLGTWLAYRHPQHIAAYVGFGQVVDGARNEELSYAFALNAAQQAGDTRAENRLRRVGPPVMGIYKGGLRGMMTQRKIMMKYGGYSQSTQKRSYLHATILPMLCAGEYSLFDLIGLVLGYRRVLNAMWHEVGASCLPQSCTRFSVPYFIFNGALDQNTPAELVEDYFNLIEAPQKELIWFTKSGHNPMGDEPEAFKSLLRARLLAVRDREECVI